MIRKEVVEYLHDVGYSRRLSAKLADIALLVKSDRPFEVALQAALEKARKQQWPQKTKSGKLSVHQRRKMLGPETSELGKIKQFKWKPHGKYGVPTARFRFSDEERGERFFDTVFSVGYGAKPGEIKIHGTIQGPTNWGPKATETGIKEALKPGTVLNLNAGWVGPRGESSDGVFSVRIDEVSEIDPKEGSGYTIKYTQLKS